VTTSHAKATTGRPRLRPLAIVVVMVIAGIVVGALAAVLFPSLSVPPSRLVGWGLGGQVPGVAVWTGTYWRGGVGFDLATAQTTTVVPLSMDRWPAECAQGDDSWLAAPAITYTPWAVIITMRETDSFDTTTCKGWYDFWGATVKVQLREPLGGRPLFDGSKYPPAPRPYP
jgi:hypothetical protein